MFLSDYLRDDIYFEKNENTRIVFMVYITE